MDNSERDALLNEIRGDIKDILQRLSRVEVKATIWGGVAGGVVVLITLAISYIKG